MKRLYFLVAVATLQIILGSLTLLQAAQPLRTSQDVFVQFGEYHLFEFGILGTGRLSGNLSEFQGRPFDLFVFDDNGYAAFRAGTTPVSPLFQQEGTNIEFDFDLPGSGTYHVVAVDYPAQRELHVHFDISVVGLKPTETIVALIILGGGLALVGAALMLSVWAWRHAPPPAVASPDPLPDGSSDPAPGNPKSAQNPRDDDTRIY